MLITLEEDLAIQREYSRRKLSNFAREAWAVIEPSTPLKWGWALDAICEHLEAVSSGEITRLLMNVPPGCMKSILTSVLFPAWEWGPLGRQNLRYLGTAHKQDLAVRDSTKCRRLIQSQWFKNLWPVNLTGDQNAKTKFENDKTGFREAMAFSGMTGSRGDRVLIDDPHSVDDANSRVKLAGDVLTFREALPSRVNNDDSAIVIIMQRLSVGDVSDVAIELGYDHLLIPMRYEAGRSKFATKRKDPRTDSGELMFPDRFPEQTVSKLEMSLGSHATAGQLQQRPNPRGGRIIKSDWFGLYGKAPTIKSRTIYADTAQKTAERNDYSVFQCWGLGDDGKIYLLDLIRGKWEAPDLERRAIDFWRKHTTLDAETHGQLRQLKIEDKASGTGLIQSIRRKGAIPVVGIQRNKDKYTRLLDVLSYIESGYVMLPGDAPFISDFLNECESFTSDDTHAHDDQIDPMIDAINDMLGNNNLAIWERMI
jgi:predicted phage terminase large subunit-like protein